MKFFQLGHKILDFFDKKDEESIKRVVATHIPEGLERRRFLKYLGVGATVAVFPSILIPTQEPLFDAFYHAWGAFQYPPNWEELGRVLSFEIHDRLNKVSITRKVLAPIPLSPGIVCNSIEGASFSESLVV